MEKLGVTAAADLASGRQLSSEEQWILSMWLSIPVATDPPMAQKAPSSSERPQLGGPREVTSVPLAYGPHRRQMGIE